MQYWHFQYLQSILHKMGPLTLLSMMIVSSCNALQLLGQTQSPMAACVCV